MDDAQWVQIVSWHVIRTATRVPGRFVTLCGRQVTVEPKAKLPSGKSCETCLRIFARRVDG